MCAPVPACMSCGGDVDGVFDMHGIQSALTACNVKMVYSTRGGRRGGAFAALCSTNSTVIAWGSSSHGGVIPQSIEAKLPKCKATKMIATESAFAALCVDGTVLAWGSTYTGGTIGARSELAAKECRVSDIFSNEMAFAALCSNGTVLTWGSAAYGGVVPAELAACRVQSISSTKSAFAALCSDGTLRTWGGGKAPLEAGAIPTDTALAMSQCTVTRVFGNHYSFVAFCSDGKSFSWGGGPDGEWGGIMTSVESQLLHTGVDTVISASKAFVAIKDSSLDNPPPGCAFWKYVHACIRLNPFENPLFCRYRSGYFALIFSNHTSRNGQCSAEWVCLCASCSTTFAGEVNSSAPGTYSLRIESGQLHCSEEKLDELECNGDEGFERAWDDVKKRDFCRLTIAQVCKTATLDVDGSRILSSSSSSLLSVRIGEEALLNVQVDGHSVGETARVEMRLVQDNVVNATVDEDGLSSFALSSTGLYQIYLVDGQSVCSLPSQLQVDCQPCLRTCLRSCPTRMSCTRVCTQVDCQPKFELRGTYCVRKKETTHQVVLGVCVGVVLSLLAGLLLYYFKKVVHLAV